MLRLWKALDELYTRLVIALFVVISLIGAWQLYDNYYLYTHTLEKSVTEYKPDPSAPETAAELPFTDSMVAWITIDGTGIDYPVMQGEDNYRFLSTDPFGSYSASGSIFLDCRSSPDFTDSFSVLYGHHMDYGKMFGALDSFLNEAYMREHSAGELIVGRDAEKVYGLEVFAAMRLSSRESTVFDLEQDAVRSYISENAEVLTSERDAPILAMSTCADADPTTRTAVFCYIIEK